MVVVKKEWKKKGRRKSRRNHCGSSCSCIHIQLYSDCSFRGGGDRVDGGGEL